MPQFTEIQGTMIPDRKPIAPGEFAYYYRDDGSGPVGLRYVCPCGCGSLGAIPFRPPHASNPPPTSDSWTWDGNMEKPTLAPSISHKSGSGKKGETFDLVEHWHGHLQEGFFKSV